MDYLNNRVQFVKLQDCMSEMLVATLGQLSEPSYPPVYLPFTFRTYSKTPALGICTCPLTTVGYIITGDVSEHRGLVDNFVLRCRENNLELCISTTMELVVDIRLNREPLRLATIQVEEMEVMQDYKDLAVHLNSRMD